MEEQPVDVSPDQDKAITPAQPEPVITEILIPVQPPQLEVLAAAPVTSAPAINVNKLTLNYTVVALVFLGVGILIGRLIFGGTGAIDAIQLRGIINEAIAQSGGLSNESVTQLVDDDPYFGPENAPITIVEFSDFNCGYCTRFATETLPQIQATYGENVRYVYRDMPIIGGNVSVESAIAAECAEDQGKFWEYHNLLFSNAEARTQDAYIGFASELGLDTGVFTTCLTDKAKSDEVLLDLLDGQAQDIRGTPAFYVNGRFISGAQPFEVFQTVINNELSKAGVDLPTG
ncbi:MAG: DsbA family protein [Anaerolineae bacterium]|nr:DsbA family protein [Anaerolineae bacterium]